MSQLSDRAIKECVTELKAASRLPIDATDLDQLVSYVANRFAELLPDTAAGHAKWVSDGAGMRDNARYIGAFADFFASRQKKNEVQLEELVYAFAIVKADCEIRVAAPGMLLDYCQGSPVDTTTARAFLAQFPPVPA